MLTEDYIYQDEFRANKYPLSRRHVVAISSTFFLSFALYFALPKSDFDSTGNHNIYAQRSDESVYDEMIDPTRSLTDILLTDGRNQQLATRSDVTLSANNNNQTVYTEKNIGSLENYEEDDLSSEIAAAGASSVDEDLEESLKAIAKKDGVAHLPSKIEAGQWMPGKIQNGDTLSSVFSDLNIPYNILQELADNRQAGRSLNSLRPGFMLYFQFDDNNNLVGFIKQISRDEQWRLTRVPGDKLEFKATREPFGSHLTESQLLAQQSEGIEAPAQRFRGRLVLVEIEKGDSFSSAAYDAGLTYAEIRQVTNLFKGSVQFTKQIQPGDTIRVLFSEDKGRGKINAVELKLQKVGTLASYRNLSDDKFYDEEGNSPVVSRFRRFPIDGKVVISSHFNPTRRHPVTGIVRPHQGTDFAVRVGTPIVAPADGVVEVAKYSRTAGYYIIMRHRGGFNTVYMHLSKILVNPGDKIKINQMIARSGNTGISTGPHLHYELRLNNRPVNAMKIDLPANEDTMVAQKQRKRFENNVALFKKELYQDNLIAKTN